MTDQPTYEGEVDFIVPGIDKPCKTWYKTVGDIKSNIPLLVLHGGPGAGHDYLLSLTDLLTKYKIPIIFYDQIGNGRSTHLPETKGDESFWRESLFIHELDNLIDHLGLRAGGFSLFGQSWGGMLGSSYATSLPKGLHKLILANTPASVDLWKQSIQLLRDGLPEDVQKVINDAERTGTTESPEYLEAVGVFYKKHLCRVEPWPAPEVEAALRWLTGDTTVYATMNGPSELTLTGSLTGWTVMDRLKNIEVPTLIYNGSMDEAQDLCVEPLFWKIPKAKWITVQGGSHFTHAEFRDQVMKLVGDFLVQ